jgi:hypothetical protein
VQATDTVSPGSSTWLPLSVNAIPDTSGSWRLRITQTAGTLEAFFIDDAAVYQRVSGTYSRNRIAVPTLSREHVAGGLHSIELRIEDSPDLRQFVIFASAQGNQDYTLTLNVSGPVGEQVRFELRAGGGSDTHTQTFTGLGTFDTISLSGTAGPDESVVRVVITAASSGAYSIFLDDSSLVPGQPAANGGEIVLDVLEPMQDRGTLDFVTVSFSRTHDSSGLVWPEDHEFEVDPQWTLWDLLDKFQGLGYRVLFAPTDWRGGGDTGWSLSLFAPGNSVIDHSGVVDGPAILPGSTIEDVRPSSAMPIETVVFGEGPAGLWSVAELSAATLTALERREGFISNQAARSATTVFRAASHRLKTTSERGHQFTATLTDHGDPLPYFHFLPEDALRAHLPSNEGRDAVTDDIYRVAAVVSKLSGSGRVMSWQVDFGNYGMYQERIRDLIVQRMLEREASENYRPGAGSVSSRGVSGGGSTATVSGIIAPHKHVQSDIVPAIDISDEDAIHDNVAGEIAAITEKVTPVSADLLIIEDSAASNTKKKVQIGNLPSGGGGGGGAPDSILYLGGRLSSETAHADDIFFDGTVGGTDIVHGSGTFDRSENIGILSLRLAGASSLESIYARAWPLTPSTHPVTIETRMSVIPGHLIANGYGLAFGFSDGTTTTSAIAGRLLRIEATGGGAETWNVEGTFAAASRTNGINDHYLDISNPLYYRVGWTAANTFKNRVSRNPVQFSAQTWADVSRTLTPTHFWVGIVSNQANQSIVTVDYVRVNEADLVS